MSKIKFWIFFVDTPGPFHNFKTVFGRSYYPVKSQFFGISTPKYNRDFVYKIQPEKYHLASTWSEYSPENPSGVDDYRDIRSTSGKTYSDSYANKLATLIWFISHVITGTVMSHLRHLMACLSLRPIRIFILLTTANKKFCKMIITWFFLAMASNLRKLFPNSFQQWDTLHFLSVKLLSDFIF